MSFKKLLSILLCLCMVAGMLPVSAQAADPAVLDLSTDDSFESTAAGYRYVNMPSSGDATLSVPAGITAFKVYDNGGKSGSYSNYCDGTLLITAPAGYILDLSGTVYTEKNYDYLIVYDGDTTIWLGSEEKITGSGTAVNGLDSSGNSMKLKFHSDSSSVSDGLNLTVTLIDLSSDLSYASIEGFQTVYAYTGSEITPSGFSVKMGNGATAPETGYTTIITKAGEAAVPKEKGLYTLTVTAAEGGDYTGSCSVDFLVANVLDGSGTEAAPYLIRTAEEWNAFAENVNLGYRYTGQVLRLENSISVAAMAGTEDSHFAGTFDGNGNTLTLNLTADTDSCAPFLYVENAVIRNLNVAGTVTTSAKYGASIAAHVYGNTSMTDCVSTVAITGTISGDGTHGGFAATVDGSATLTFTRCAFKGSLLGETSHSSGGFVGWNSGSNKNIQYTDCLFDPAQITMSTSSSNTFNRNGNNSYTRTWYTTTFGTTDSGAKQVYSTLPDGQLCKKLTLFGSEYYLPCTVSGIASSYVYTGEEIALTPTVTVADGSTPASGTDYTLTFNPTPVKDPEDYTYTLTGSGSDYAGSCTGSFTLLGLLPGEGSDTAPYRIEDSEDWALFAANVAGGNTYEGKYIRLDADNLTVSAMVGDQNHPFKGSLDGNHKTLNLDLNFVTIDTSNNANKHKGLFGKLEGASIHDLTFTGSVATNTAWCGGLANLVTGNTDITDCVFSYEFTSQIAASVTGMNRLHGGVAATVDDGTLTVERCVFNGKLTLTGKCSCGFVGEAYNDGYIKLIDCLLAPQELVVPPDGNNTNCYTFAYNYNNTVELTRCYYTQAIGEEQGIPVSAAPYADGEGIYSSLTLFTNTYYTKGSVTDVRDHYHYTGSPLTLTLPTVSDYQGSVLMKDTDYEITVSPADVQEKGSYTLTVSGIGSCSGSESFTFVVDDVPDPVEGMAVDKDFQPSQAGYFYALIPESGTTTLDLTDGLITAFKVYDYKGKSGYFSNDFDGYLQINAPAGYTIRVTGTLSLQQNAHYTYLYVYDSDGTTQLGQYSLSSTTVEKESTGSSITLRLKNSSNYSSQGPDLIVELLSKADDLSHAEIRGLQEIYPYTGSSIAPAFTVVHENGSTIDASNYSVSFTLNGQPVTEVEAKGTYTVTATGIDSCVGSVAETFYVLDPMTGTGTEADPFLIGSVADWNTFGDDLMNGYDFSGKFVQLSENVAGITVMAGDADHPFRGSFDGNHNTLTLALTAETDTCAPFGALNGAEIHDLTVDGSITTSGKYAAGIAAHVTGNTAITGCKSAVAITSSVSGEGIHGGLVARHAGGTLTISGCVFTGSLLGPDTTKCGGIVGGRENHSFPLTIADCIFAPAELTFKSGYTFCYFMNGSSGSYTLSNSYYTDSLYYSQGYAAAYTAPEEGFYRQITVLDVTVYATGLSFDAEEHYTWTGSVIDVPRTVTFNRSALTEGTDYSLAITLNGEPVTRVLEDGVYVFTATGLPAGGCGGTASRSILVTKPLEGTGAAGDPYLISSGADWYTFATSVNYDNSYSGKFVELRADITAEHTAGTNGPFKGSFNGNGYTVTLNMTEYSKTGQFAGLFGHVEGAVIENVKVTGTVSNPGSSSFAGGIAGHVAGTGNVIRNCTVSAAVSAGNYAGGIVGELYGGTLTLNNCVFKGTLGSQYNGGLIGYCLNTNTVNADTCLYAGANIQYPFGFKGYSDSTAVTANVQNFYTTVQGTNTYNIYQGGELVLTALPENELAQVDASIFPDTPFYTLCAAAGIDALFDPAEGGVLPKPVFTLGNQTLVPGTDYTLTYTKDGETVTSDEITGIYTVTARGVESEGYAGEKSYTYTVYPLPQGMSYTPEEGFYINLPSDGSTVTVTIPDTEYRPVYHVYDDGGRTGDISARSTGTVVFRAPAGYGLQVSGNADIYYYGNSYVNLYDAASADADALIYQASDTVTFGPYFAYSGDLTVLFWCDTTYPKPGFALTVEQVDTETILNAAHLDTLSEYFYDGTEPIVLDPVVTSSTGTVFDSSRYTWSLTDKATGQPVSNEITLAGTYTLTVTPAQGSTLTGSLSQDFRVIRDQGTGTEDDPILIQTWIDWQDHIAADVAAKTSSGKHYQLTGDFTVPAVTGVYYYSSEDNRAFQGVLDGNGHTLTLSIDASGLATCAGLFPLADGAVFRNLRLEGSFSDAPYGSGVLVGCTYGAVVIEDCVCHVTFTAKDNAYTIGGFVGRTSDAESLTINRSAFTGELLGGSSQLGGFVGEAYSNHPVTLTNCVFDPHRIGNAEQLSTFAYVGSGSLTLNFCWYSAAAAGAGTVQGRQLGGTGLARQVLSVGNTVYRAAAGTQFITGSPFICNGTDPITADITVKFDGETLTPGTDYTYVITGPQGQVNNGEITVPGEYTVTVTGAHDQETGEGYYSSITGSFIVDNAIPGSGTEDDPYLISTAAQWIFFARSVNGGNAYADQFVKLSDNFDNSADPITEMLGTYEHPFSGILDGNGRTLTVAIVSTETGDTDAANFVAPIRCIQGATVKNLTLAGSVRSASRYASGLVGCVLQREEAENLVLNCAVGTDITIDGTGYLYPAGIVGYIKTDVTVDGCFFNGSLTMTTQHNDTGNLVVGNRYGSSVIAHIRNCLVYTDGFAAASQIYVPGRPGWYYPYDYENNYYVASGTEGFTPEDNTYRAYETLEETNGAFCNLFTCCGHTVYGVKDVRAEYLSYAHTGSVITNVADRVRVTYGGNDLTQGTDYTFTVTNSQNVDVTASLQDVGDYTVTYSGVAAAGYYGTATGDLKIVDALQGSGTEADPFKINTAEEWSAFAEMVNGGHSFADEYVQLMADLQGITQCVGLQDSPFSGTFLGNNTTVTVALSSESTIDQGTALFRFISGAAIQDLTVAGTVSTDKNYGAGLVGAASGENTITNCVVTASITTTAAYTGGVVGYVASGCTTLVECAFLGSVQCGEGSPGSKSFGGILGYSGNTGSTVCVMQGCLENAASMDSAFYRMNPLALKYFSNDTVSSAENCWYVHDAVNSGTGTYYGQNLASQYARKLLTAQPEGLSTKFTNLPGGGIYYISCTASMSNTHYALADTSRHPGPTVKNYLGAELVKDTDYSLAFEPAEDIVEGSYTVTVTGLGSTVGSTSFTYNIVEVPEGLRADETVPYGEPGFFCINMTKDTHSTLNLSDVDLDGLTFTVYDDRGGNNYCDRDTKFESLTVTAPEGWKLEFYSKANSVYVSSGDGSLDILDGSGNSLLAGPINDGSPVIPLTVTPGNVLKIDFKGDDYYTYARIGIIVRLVADNAAHAVTTAITGEGTVTFRVNGDPNATMAGKGDTVTLAGTPAAGYESRPFRVADCDGTALILTDNSFTMGSKPVTVYADFVPFEQVNGYRLYTQYESLAGGAALVDNVMDVDYEHSLDGDGYYVEFKTAYPIIPKGYVIYASKSYSYYYDPTEVKLEARLSETGEWTQLDQRSFSSSNYGGPLAIENEAQYQVFRFQVLSGWSDTVHLPEIRLFGENSFLVLCEQRDATCTAIGCAQDCWYDAEQQKYYADEAGETELAAADVEIPMISHTLEHHAAVEPNGTTPGSIEYWECSMCGGLFRDAAGVITATQQDIPVYGEFAYLDENGVSQSTSGTKYIISNSDTQWKSVDADWFILTKDTVIPTRVLVIGDIKLILCDGATLNVAGITVDPGNSLTVYSQSLGDGMGEMNSVYTTTNTSYYYTAIGAGTGGYYHTEHAGDITIRGGKITARVDAGKYGSRNYGLGGENSNITITGGQVEAGITAWNGTLNLGFTDYVNDQIQITKLDGYELTVHLLNNFVTDNGKDLFEGGSSIPTEGCTYYPAFRVNYKSGSPAASCARYNAQVSVDPQIFAGITPAGKTVGAVTEMKYYTTDPEAANILEAEDSFTFTMPAEDVTVEATEFADAVEPQFRSHTLLLSGEIGVNFYIDLSMLAEEEKEAAYVEFTVNGETTTDTFDPNSTNPSTHQYHGFTCYISSVQMADEITAVLHYGEDKTVSQSYSAKEYLQVLNNNPGSYTEPALALARAIGDYGHYVQPFLAGPNGWTVGTEHAEMPASSTLTNTQVQEAKAAVAEKTIVRDTGESGIEKVTFSLALETETAIRVYLKVKEDYEGEVTAVMAGEPITCEKQKDGRYCIEITGISAHKLGDTYEITVTAGEAFTIKVSALSYVDTVLTSTAEVFNNTTAQYAVTSLYRYYKATMDYRDSLEQGN